jgi:hypothetical protein
VDSLALDYPSYGIRTAFVDPQKYFGGARRGIDALTQILAGSSGACATRPVVLIGYSQGAMVINRTLVELQSNRPQALRRIAAVALIADPQRIGTAPYTRGGAYSGFNGLSIALGAYPPDDLPTVVRDGTDSYCVRNDLVCAWDPSRSLTAAAGAVVTEKLLTRHSSYATNGDAAEAGARAAQRLAKYLRSSAIRAVDFQNTTYPAGTCRSGTWLNPEPIPVVNGVGSSGSDPSPPGQAGYSFAELRIGTDEPTFVDLDGDGVEEAVLAVGCDAGGAEGDEFIVALKIAPNGTLNLLGGQNLTPVAAPALKLDDSRITGAVAVERATIVVHERVELRWGEPRCCYSGTATTRWTFSNGQWHSDVHADNVPPTLDTNAVTTDGIGDLKIGDPITKATALTGATPTAACPALEPTTLMISDAFGDLDLFFRPTQGFVEFRIRASRYSTPSGGHGFMTAQELQTKIPYAMPGSAPYGQSALVVHSGDNVLYFTLRNGLVDGIIGGLATTAGYTCG